VEGAITCHHMNSMECIFSSVNHQSLRLLQWSCSIELHAENKCISSVVILVSCAEVFIVFLGNIYSNGSSDYFRLV